MDHIKQTLARRIKQSGIARQVSTALLIEDFKKMFEDKLGENASKRIKPLYIKNRILTVACLSSVIAQEINFHKMEFINEINKKNDAETIHDIRFIL